MSTWRLLLIALFAFGLFPTSHPVAAQSPRLLEFLDDFTKPVRLQRDPFEERIETERHDFTQSATTVGRGVFQIESGYSFFFKETKHETESAHTFPEMLLRFGISEDLELRIRWNHAWVFIKDEADRIGAEDLRISLKMQLTREVDFSLLPTSALELRGLAPTSGAPFSTGKTEFSFDYIYQWTLIERISLAGSTGFGTRGFGEFGILPDQPTEQYFNVLSQSVAMGLELSEVNTVYLEWYGLYSEGLEDEFTVSVFNVGLDHYLSDNLVVDFRVGIGLSGDSDDFFSGVGGGYRF